MMLRHRVLPCLAIVTALGSAAACDDLRNSTEPLPIGATLLVRPVTDTIFVGDTVGPDDSLRLSAMARTFAGDTVAIAGVKWESSDTSIATVDASGVVRALRVGEVTITAAAGERASARIVIAPATAELTLTPTADTLVLGDSLQLLAQAFDASGNPVAAVRYEYASDHTGVASVDSTGLVRAIAEGDTRISVSAAGRQAFADIAVRDTTTPPVLPPLPPDTIP
ncbi:MAG TPA: Ig-like domain-containing protein [Gemmatimonadaceae bacterium]|nr:Ig-like domain-containing protein [Gemmatimonadaceae bacterium]